MDWPSIALVVSAIVFAVVLLLRVRPSFSSTKRPDVGLREAKEAVQRAKTDEEKIEALAAAGDASAVRLGRGGSAVNYYLRAMRMAPTSLPLLERAGVSLANKPLALESLLWRRLSIEDWTDEMVPIVRDIVRRLETLYSAGPIQRRLRARAFATLSRALAKL